MRFVILSRESDSIRLRFRSASFSIFQLRSSVASSIKAMSTVKDEKITLRKEISSRLSALSQDDKKKQSAAVAEKVLESREYLESERISIFLSTANEIDTKPMIARIFRDSKQCFIPRYSKQGMEMVKLLSMEDWESLPLTSWKIKQPKLKEEREDAINTGGLDLLIVPGVGFTKNGKRLGHGGGYYDRYIHNLRNNQEKPIFTIGVAFREQILDNIPIDDYDQIIDRIVYIE